MRAIHRMLMNILFKINPKVLKNEFNYVFVDTISNIKMY